VNQEKSEKDEADSTALLMHITRLLHILTAAANAESGFALIDTSASLGSRVWVLVNTSLQLCIYSISSRSQ